MGQGMINEERLYYLKSIGNKEITLPELREKLGDGYTHDRVGHMLNRLERDGFVERSVYQNGCVRSVWLTEKGKKCLKL